MSTKITYNLKDNLKTLMGTKIKIYSIQDTVPYYEGYKGNSGYSLDPSDVTGLPDLQATSFEGIVTEVSILGHETGNIKVTLVVDIGEKVIVVVHDPFTIEVV